MISSQQHTLNETAEHCSVVFEPSLASCLLSIADSCESASEHWRDKLIGMKRAPRPHDSSISNIMEDCRRHRRCASSLSLITYANAVFGEPADELLDGPCAFPLSLVIAGAAQICSSGIERYRASLRPGLSNGMFRLCTFAAETRRGPPQAKVALRTPENNWPNDWRSCMIGALGQSELPFVICVL